MFETHCVKFQVSGISAVKSQGAFQTVSLRSQIHKCCLTTHTHRHCAYSLLQSCNFNFWGRSQPTLQTRVARYWNMKSYCTYLTDTVNAVWFQINLNNSFRIRIFICSQKNYWNQIMMMWHQFGLHKHVLFLTSGQQNFWPGFITHFNSSANINAFPTVA